MDWYQCLSQRDLGLNKKWRASQRSGNPGISDENAGNFGNDHYFPVVVAIIVFTLTLEGSPIFLMKRWIFNDFFGMDR